MTTQNPLSETAIEQATKVHKTWIHACKLEDLVYNSGVCALVENKQIAIFAVCEKTSELSKARLYACDNYDPIGQANVLSRGLICSIKSEVCISSPLYKQHFSLASGECLEQPEKAITVYSVKLENGQIYINLPVQNPTSEETSLAY